MNRPFGLGLRAQIVFALSLAFFASFTLLGLATVQLSKRARTLDRSRAAEATATVLAAAVEQVSGDRRARLRELTGPVLGRAGIAGVEIELPGNDEPFAQGVVVTGSSVEAPLARGGVVRLWLRGPGSEDAAPLTNLVLLYVAVTGGAILLLTYVALTYLIVRPVSAVTRASERLASGSRHVDVPVRGAAELARLAVAFNSMATQLRADRQSLEDRLLQIHQTTAQLDSAEEQVLRSERLASVGRLAAGVAHEIGNPLAAVLGLVEILRDGDVDEEDQAEFLRRIQAETERINKIIRDLLDFSRQGGPEEPTESADLVAVVDDAASLVAPQKDLREVMIERRFEEEAPRVRGSADRLTQLVLNLLLNAADAIDGDGSIRVEVRSVESGEEGALPDGPCVELTVTDSGPGIAPDVLEHLFEPFVTTKSTGRGTGLGLAVCHTIVERLGGTVRAENAAEGGARFVVRLPAVAPLPAHDEPSADVEPE